MSENKGPIIEIDDSDNRPTRDMCIEAIADLMEFVDQIVYRPDGTATEGVLLSERWKFKALDERVAMLARPLGVEDALPDRDRLPRLPDSRFEGRCNVPGEWHDGVFLTFAEPVRIGLKR